MSPELLAPVAKRWLLLRDPRRRTQQGRTWMVLRWWHGGKTYDDKPANPRYNGLTSADRPKVAAEVAEMPTITALRDDDVIRFATSTGRTTVTLKRAKKGCFQLDVLRDGQAVKKFAAEYASEADGRRVFADRSRMVQNEDALVALLAADGRWPQWTP